MLDLLQYYLFALNYLFSALCFLETFLLGNMNGESVPYIISKTMVNYLALYDDYKN